MILQALVSYYESLVAAGKIESPGWSKQKVSHALDLNDSGEIVQVYPLSTDVEEKGKKKEDFRRIEVPAPVKRAVNVLPNFLCDHSGYLLGVDTKGKPERTAECFEACKALHEKLLTGVDSPAARAVLAFFAHWDPAAAAETPALKTEWEKLIGGGNLLFRYQGVDVSTDPAIRQCWNTHYQSAKDDVEMPCLVTGQVGPVERIHPAIKGVRDAQSSGAALVSFNSDSFCSYGKEQNLNAPTSKYAAFAYTAALNRLLSDKEHILWMGDTTVVFWAESSENAYQDAFDAFLSGDEQLYTDTELWHKTKKLMAGESVLWDDTRLDPSTRFYLLGISPNAARLSVRFFLQGTFGAFLQNVQAHYDRMEIVKNAKAAPIVPIWRMLQETVNPNSKDKASSPQMTGSVLQAVLANTRYPATLLNGVTLRIRADRVMNRERAATIKAYYLQNPHKSVPKEVLTVSLNRETDNVPYCLGRLFATLEYVQRRVNPDLNTTIKDKYFSSASATPAVVFPTLINLAQAHLKKLNRSDPGGVIYLNKLMTEILDKLHEQYPNRMSLPEQGAFQLGYYHQNSAFYTKKQEETENV